MVNGQLIPGALETLSVKPIVTYLSELLSETVEFVPGQDFKKIRQQIDKSPSRLFMLENLRFWPGELTNDPHFAKDLASLADFYVNDAFAVSHRQQASVAAIKDFLPSFAGYLLEQEVVNLSQALSPHQPLIVVVGGAKINTKVNFLRHLGEKAAKILLGGALANNFLAARGYNVGQSLVDKESIALSGEIIKELGDKLILPLDVIVKNQGRPVVRSVNQVADDDNILDIGPATMQAFSREIKSAKTLVWNGPMGKFEEDHYQHGTLFVAREIAWRSRGPAFGIVGGGETVEALEMTKMTNYVDWVSTGGGAMLAFLGGEPMPGLEKIIY
jgi:3-phosphoglycerate kinase